MKKTLFVFLLLLLMCVSALGEENILPYTDAETGETFLFLPSFMPLREEEGVTVLKSENLPAVFIDTQTANMDTVNSDKNEKEPASIRLYGVDGVLLVDEPLEYIKGHGNATWQAEKKSYQIKFLEKTDLFEMGKAKKWLLMANAQDGSYLRNKLLYDAVAALQIPYGIESQFVDVYLNGHYAGNYLLTEKMEEGKNRVLLPENSYLIEVENQPNPDDITFETEWGTLFRLHYPENENTDFIQEKAQALENAFIDMEGYAELMDLESFARKAVLDEISKNNDGFEGSTFFYLTEENNWRFNGDLYWDYDSTFGNWSYRYGYYKDPMGLILPDLTVWYETLYQDEAFKDEMKTQYLRAKPVFQAYIETGIDQWETLLEASATMDYARYKGNFTLTKKTDLHGQTQGLKTFIAQRLAFLDSAILEGTAYVRVFLSRGEEDSRFVWVPYGTKVGEIEPGTRWCYEGREEMLQEEMALTFSCALSVMKEAN